MSTSELPTTAWRVTRIELDAFMTKVTFEGVSWSETNATEDEIEEGAAEWFDVEPGTPNSVWVGTGDHFTLPLAVSDAGAFFVGQHVTVGMTEIREAEMMEA